MDYLLHMAGTHSVHLGMKQIMQDFKQANKVDFQKFKQILGYVQFC